MIKKSQIAYGVRVVLNDNFEPKCLGDTYLVDEPVLFISEEKAYNDTNGEYVILRGGSLTNSGYAYLDQLDLAFQVPENPLYDLYPDNKEDIPLGMNERSDVNLLPPHYTYQPEPYFKGKGMHNVLELEEFLIEYKEYGHQQGLIKQKLIGQIRKGIDSNDIQTYNISTSKGKLTHDLPFLNDVEVKELNIIGYSGKDSNGNKVSREEYLNDLNKGIFSVVQTKRDNGDFVEEFLIIRVNH